MYFIYTYAILVVVGVWRKIRSLIGISTVELGTQYTRQIIQSVVCI